MLTIMLNRRRKAMIGYATYAIGKRVARSMVRRRLSRLLEREQPARRRRRLPLIGAGLAIAAGAAAFFLRGRGNGE
jgi:hypothetical protein